MICRLRTFRTLWGSWHSLVVRDPLLHCSGPCSRTSLFSSNLGFVTCSYICLFFSLCKGFGWGIGLVCLCGLSQKVVARRPVVRCQRVLCSAVAVFQKEGYVDLGQTKDNTTLWLEYLLAAFSLLLQWWITVLTKWYGKRYLPSLCKTWALNPGQRQMPVCWCVPKG